VGVIVVSYLIFHLFEKLAPAEKGQKYGAIGTNAGITATYLLHPLAMFFPSQMLTGAVQWAGGPWLDLSLSRFLESQGQVARFFLLLPLAVAPIFVFNLLYYWFHRLQHTSPWLWEQHKLHHTDTSLNVATSLRHHWTEVALRAFLILIPMNALIKMSPVGAGVIGVMIGQWGYFIHANVRLPLGPLTWVFVGPQAHRIHHSLEPRHIGKNLAAFFSDLRHTFRYVSPAGARRIPCNGRERRCLESHGAGSPVRALHRLVGNDLTLAGPSCSNL